jgi:hypothetical protein
VASRSQPVSFEQAKPAIEQYLTAERRREFATKEMKGLREAAKIEYLGKFVNKPATAAAPASAPAPTTTPASEPASAELAASSSLSPAAMNKGLSGLR